MGRKIAVIGSGYWGKNLVRNFAHLGALHTICDTDTERLNSLKGLYPDINTTTGFAGVLTDKAIEGVVLSTPAELHYGMAKEALLANKHLLVEKPLALKVNQGKELVRLAEERGRILMVGHLLEYHGGILKLKELIDQGDLGKINYIYSNRLNLGKFRTEENILWSFAPHDISVILLLLGEMPQEVFAHGGSYLHHDRADVTVTLMNFASGVRAHIFVSWLHPYKEQKLIVVGDRKMALFDDVTPHNKLLLFHHQIEWVERIPVPRLQDAEPIEFSPVEPLRAECEHFLDCISQGKAPRTDGHNGLRVLRILDACEKSLQEKGRSIPLAHETGEEKGFYAHETCTIDEPCRIGEGTRIWHYSHVMAGAAIGRDCSIGQNVFIGAKVHIGDRTKIQNNVSVYEGITIENEVFCGPSMVFTNVINPRSAISRKDEFKSTLVKKGATIGANATIVCGHTIGRYAFIGAGAVITGDVPDYALVVGIPGRRVGWMCQCGVKLALPSDNKSRKPVTKKVNCGACKKEYEYRKSGTEEQLKELG